MVSAGQMLNMRLFFLIWSVCLLILPACKQRLPDGVMDEQKMVRVLADLHTIDGYMSTLRFSDTVRTSGTGFYNTVYKHHNISRSVFEKSLEYYSKNPALLDSLYGQAEDILKAREARLYKIEEEEQRKMMKSK